jgi:hypothetical protein
MTNVTSKLNIKRSNNQVPTYAIPTSSFSYTVQVDQVSAVSIPIPESTDIAILEYGGGAACLVNEGPLTATRPPVNSFEFQSARINPSAMVVTPGSNLYIQSYNTTDVCTVNFYSSEDM